MSAQFGPFTLNDLPSNADYDRSTIKSQCLLCDDCFNLGDEESFEEFLRHLLMVHKLVVADIRLIADIEK